MYVSVIERVRNNVARCQSYRKYIKEKKKIRIYLFMATREESIKQSDTQKNPPQVIQHKFDDGKYYPNIEKINLLNHIYFLFNLFSLFIIKATIINYY